MKQKELFCTDCAFQDSSYLLTSLLLTADTRLPDNPIIRVKTQIVVVLLSLADPLTGSDHAMTGRISPLTPCHLSYCTPCLSIVTPLPAGQMQANDQLNQLW